MTAAAKHPTRAILEVGVKSLVLIDSNVDTSVLIILKGETLNSPCWIVVFILYLRN